MDPLSAALYGAKEICLSEIRAKMLFCPLFFNVASPLLISGFAAEM